MTLLPYPAALARWLEAREQADIALNEYILARAQYVIARQREFAADAALARSANQIAQSEPAA